MSLLSGHSLAKLARSRARRALLSALVSFAFGCTESTSPAPAPARPAPAPTTPTAPPPSPPTISGSASFYLRVSPLTYGPSDGYLLSSGADSAFSIIFPNGDRSWAWSGRYERADSLLIFHYNAWSLAGELGARGILHGDTLFLRYNLIMQMTDFEDGVYVRSPLHD